MIRVTITPSEFHPRFGDLLGNSILSVVQLYAVGNMRRNKHDVRKYKDATREVSSNTHTLVNSQTGGGYTTTRQKYVENTMQFSRLVQKSQRSDLFFFSAVLGV